MENKHSKTFPFKRVDPLMSEYLFINLFIVIIFALILAKLIIFFVDFSRQLKSINFEIKRTSGSVRRYWIKKKRRLWLSLIPFIKY